MGWRYFIFRLGYEFRRRAGLLKRGFPTHYIEKQHISFEEWKGIDKKFFFESRETLNITKQQDETLERIALDIFKGKHIFFSSLEFDLGVNYNWITNPETNFQYDLVHWTKINDFSKKAGDIKYVWEKSRFSYIYYIIRYDYHFDKDSSKFVFDEIESWLEANPINRGPNYKCSQEISLRVLNWIYILNFYKNSSALTEDLFQRIINSIQQQIEHVYENINFSRIAVRNNHAITETLTLYLVGLLMPFLPDSERWKTKGKRWFEEEVAYQIYQDGTFLQFSMNYHRVVIQLLSWALVLAKKNNEIFNEVVYQRAESSIKFLRTCQASNGWLPNYGANDGALFFPLNSNHYRDFRPQLQALASFFEIDLLYNDSFEDNQWFYENKPNNSRNISLNTISSFDIGGYYIIRDNNSITFLRCGNHKDRPSQADNLHLDIWIDDKNLLIDAGSYKYNTDEETIRYFNGTASHNTVMLGNYDQMLKGARFIWYNWTQSKKVSILEELDSYTIQGSIDAFSYIKKGIEHKRIIRKKKNENTWIVKDVVEHSTNEEITQIWNYDAIFAKNISIQSSTEGNRYVLDEGLSSSFYGKKQKTKQFKIIQKNKIIETTISINI